MNGDKVPLDYQPGALVLNVLHAARICVVDEDAERADDESGLDLLKVAVELEGQGQDTLEAISVVVELIIVACALIVWVMEL